MKKILSILLIFIFSLHTSFAYNLSSSDQDLGDTVTEKILEQNAEYRQLVVDKISEFIEEGNYSEKITAILEYIQLRILLTIEVPEEIPAEIKQENEIILEEKEEEVGGEAISQENIDFSIVKNNWLDWNNELRSELGLDSYGFETTLEESALVWSTQARNKGNISHMRNPGDSFYDYNIINSWFADNGVSCENVSGITHTENIWWGSYGCSDGECSQELSSATRRAFDAYVAEKGTPNDAHYRSLTQEYFNNIGIGIAIDETGQDTFDYYLTIHYCTNLED